jgi:hypothetical protein
MVIMLHNWLRIVRPIRQGKPQCTHHEYNEKRYCNIDGKNPGGIEYKHLMKLLFDKDCLNDRKIFAFKGRDWISGVRERMITPIRPTVPPVIYMTPYAIRS